MNAIRQALGPYADAVSVAVYDTVESTNDLAREEARDPKTALYIARAQTAGRGRLGRSFYSPAHTGLYMTLAYTTEEPLTRAVRVTALAAVAAVAALEALTDKHPSIKWVNDIYLEGCKIGGILTEAIPRSDGSHRILVGLGINLTTAEFPEGLRAPAASLFSPGEIPPGEEHTFGDRLAGEITRRLLEAIDSPSPYLSEFYRDRLLYVGEPVLCTRGNETFEGVVLGVDPDFSLLVSTKAGTLTLSSGEISVRPRS